jgi:outer membrane protein OmpA-like peptidoglycan-associated protein
MKEHLRFIFGIAALFFFLASCQTTKPVKVSPALTTPAASSIATEALGFSPKAEAGHNSIDFSLTFGNPEKIKAWKVEMKSDRGVQKTFSGSGSSLPVSLSWDGEDNAGNLSPEGNYAAALSVDYVDTYSRASVSSSSFLVDTTPPTGKLLIAPANLVPTGNGFASPASITIDASSSLAKIDSWSLDILEPDGKVFRSFSELWPKKDVSWDGLSSNGEQVSPLTTYKAIAELRDEFGNTGELSVSIPVADVPSASGSTLIEAKYDGFAPKGESSVKTMDFVVSIGDKEAVVAWKITIVGDQGIQKTQSGDSTNIPSSFSWDGTTDSGVAAPQGRYAASLVVGYGMAFKPVAVRSRSFILDVTPPSGTIVSNPTSLTPDGKGGLSPMTFTVVANSDIAPLDSWDLNVYGLDAKAVISARGKFPKNSYTWDGKLPGGATLDPSRSYKIAAKATDVYGNAGIVRGTIGIADIPEVTSTVSITPKTRGFSPNGDNTMDLAISYGQPQAVISWTVKIADGDRVVQTYTGDSNSLPAVISWDGKKTDGTLADEGNYIATLSIDYGTTFKAVSAKSAAFVLDLSTPTGRLNLSQPIFSPIESNPTLTITVDASSKIAKMESWSIKIFDPAGNLFRSFDGQWPNNQAAWDGKSSSGEMVDSAEDYAVAATVRDEFGNSAALKSMIPVDILVEKTATGYRILSSRIFFKAFTADYVDVAPDLSRQNVQRLDQLAAKLKKFPGYRIKVVGHAVMINWDDKAKGKVEQEQILIPLSKSRAEAVKQAMVDRGLDPSIVMASGVGAADQLVPDSDLVDRWRNRRVAFYLEKP